jgi:hypothetical protein
MKRFYILLLLSFTFNQIVNAQKYKPFKVGLGVGPTLSIPSKDYPYGIMYAIEPAYYVSDDWSIGFRIEGASNRIDSELVSTDFHSYTINGQYYLLKNKTRLFLGAGLGLFTSDFYYYSTVSVFGFYPRVGIDLGHFSLCMDYNFISTPDYVEEYTYNYLNFRMGFFFGGDVIQSTQTDK